MEAVARESFMIDEFLAKLEKEGDARHHLVERHRPEVLFHGHCHQKALIGMGPSMAMLKAAGCSAQESGAGVAAWPARLATRRSITTFRARSAKSGFSRQCDVERADDHQRRRGSCHQQIEHFTERKTQHIAEVLAERIAPVTPGRRRLLSQSGRRRADARIDGPCRNTGEGPA